MIRTIKIPKKSASPRGFTLIELLVTIGIFILLSTVVMVNFRQVDNSLVLQNVAHQVALVIRKAQISGISVQGISSGGSTVFPSYGVNFDITRNTSFALFADINTKNKLLDSACSSVECIQRYTLANGYTIKNIYGNQKTNAPGSGTSLDRLDITFTRPNPDALIVGNSVTTSPFSDAEIVIQSRQGITKTIVIWRTGQISIE